MTGSRNITGKNPIEITLLKSVQNERGTNFMSIYVLLERVYNRASRSVIFSISFVSDGVAIDVCNNPFHNKVRLYLNICYQNDG